MEEKNRFGAKIRRLRLKAQLTQRDLAAKVGVDFTYLSKIENGVLPPPAEKIILNLARVLNADKDELNALAGRVPSDISMMLRSQDTSEFGKKLREMRVQAGLSQKDLADRVNIKPSYLSKIETGAKTPPSEKVILKLAEVLGVDKNEFVTSAGRVSPDLAKILREPEALQSLRVRGFDRQGRVSKEDQGEGRVSKEDQGEGKVLKPRRNSLMPIRNLFRRLSLKSLPRLATAVTLVALVAASLWYAAPARALEVNFPSLPASGITGGTYSFTLEITIAEAELFPIDSIDLGIYNVAAPGTYVATAANLPLASGAKNYTSAQTGGGAVAVTASAAPTWGIGYGPGSASWQGYGYSFFAPGGYGYGYRSSSGAASITYSVNWTPPVSWPVGVYKAKATIAANSETFTKTSAQITLSLGGGIAGEVLLQSRGAAPGNDWVTPVTVNLWAVGADRNTATPVATYNVTTSDNGTFEITGITPNSYDITVKGSHTLSKLTGNKLISAGALTTVNWGTLIEGDAWGPGNQPDNLIDISDYSAILYAFGAQGGDPEWVETCDLNEDTVVDISDYSIVLYNFGQSGE